MVQGQAVVVGKLVADAGGDGPAVARVCVRQGLFPKGVCIFFSSSFEIWEETRFRVDELFAGS